MKLKVIRKEYTSKSTIGELWIDGVFFAYTLEDEDRIGKGLFKVFGQTAIPKGLYKVIISRSNRFSKLLGKDIFLPEILNIPEFLGVRVHAGNKPEDTEGCVLIGLTKTKDSIGMSAIAMQRLMERLKGQTDITIEIV